MSRHEAEDIKTRPLVEIQRAHDSLVAIILGDVPNPFPPDSIEKLSEAAAVLCWVLCHDHNASFGNNLRQIEQSLAEQGLQLVNTGRLNRRGACTCFPVPGSALLSTTNPECPLHGKKA